MSTVDYWLKSSEDDLDTAVKLMDGKKYHHALFFLHLAIEKLLKAILVKKTDEAAPPIHDLVRLSEKTSLHTSQVRILEFAEISTFNIAARYDDYKLQFYKKATSEYAQKWMTIGKAILTELKKEL